MLRSLYSGISGLRQHQQGMDVVGNNIANVNTTGFKSSRVIFEDLFSQTLSGARAPSGNTGGVDPTQIGTGVGMATVDNIFTEGTPESTGVTTDLALEGNGFFVVRGQGENEDYYTRAGHFTFDRDGNMVNPSGYIAQGWMADPETGRIQTDVDAQDMKITEAHRNLAPQETTEAMLAGNLDTRADASILEFQKLTTYAAGDTPLSSLYDTNGTELDLSQGEPVIIKAHGTGDTDMSSLYDEFGTSLGVESGDTIDVTYNSATTTLTYGTDFNTLSDFITQLDIITGGTSSLNNGSIETNLANGDTLSFTSPDTNLESVLSGLEGTYDGTNSQSSGVMNYQNEIVTGIDFENMNELAGEIQSALNNVSTGFTATYDDTQGKILYDNAGPQNISGLEISKAYSGNIFENNLLNTDTINSGGTTDSDIFLRNADSNTVLADLFDSSGQSLGLDTNSQITAEAIIGGENPGNNFIPVDGDALLSDLFGELESYMGLNNGGVNITDGVITLKGEKGVKNNIDSINFEAIDTTDGSAIVTFNNTINDYSIEQEAEGGQLVTSQTLYDQLGNANVVNYDFTLSDSQNNIWKLDLSSDNPEYSAEFENVQNDLFVQFNDDGSFRSAFYNDNAGNRVNISNLSYSLFDSGNNPVIENVALNLGSSGEYNGMTTSAAESNIKKTDQDGYTRGELDRLNINDAGEIIGSYTNGELKTLGQIGVASFANQDGLLKVGETMFATTPNSGDAAIGRANTGGRGIIKSGYIENSNVDLAKEFVDMIKMQRGYQANSRTITTSDEMLQELMNLKR